MASAERGRSRRRGDGVVGSSRRNAARSATPTAVGHQGVTTLRKQTSYPGILSDSLFEAGNMQSRNTSGIPMKMLIDEEMSKDVSTRHISPGAVGRLMGLESLPTSGIHSQCRCTQGPAPRASPGSSYDYHGLYQDIPHRRSADDIRDVFEITEALKTKKHRSPVSRSGNTYQKSDKIDDADIDFLRQKFVDAKHLSNDKSLHMSEEFNETLDALVSNRDLLVEFIRKFDPVVGRDLHNQGSLSSTANCITILKPSRRNQFTGMDNVYPQVKDTESYYHMQNEAKHFLRKPYSNVTSQCLKEDSGSLRQKLSRSSHQENADKQAGPTRIVVLKPCLDKTRDIDGDLTLNHEIPHSDFRRRKECEDVGRWSPYSEEYICQVSLEDSGTLGHIRKGSREIAREITKQMRAARGESKKHVVKPEIRTSVSEKRSQFLPSVTKLKTSDAFHRSGELLDTWASSSFNSSPSYSTETSVSKEAKKHISNRWKKTHQYQRQKADNDGFSTLGDMLALSDQETSDVGTRKMACQKCPKEEVQTDRMQGSCIYPFGISSNDGWRDVAAIDLTRSKSLPPSLSRGVQRSNNRRKHGSISHNEFSVLKDVLKVGPPYSEDSCRSRQRQSFSRGSTFPRDASDPMSPENVERMVEREIHVNYEEPANVSVMPDISEKSQHPAHLDNELDAVGLPDVSSIVPEKMEESVSPAGQSHQIFKNPAAALDDSIFVPNLDDFVAEDGHRAYQQADDCPATYDPQIESASFVGIHSQQMGDNQTLCIPSNSPESSTSSKDDDQESPISVLESSMSAEDVYSGDFEKINADLQELKMQLRSLKRETTDNGEDTEIFILSDDETAYQPPPEMKTSHAFRDEDERDFCYMLDMLAYLGIHAATQDELLNNCYLMECPAGPDLFDKLENKYRSLILWPHYERKLLFDVTHTVIVDIMTSLLMCGSKGSLRWWSHEWDQEEFVEMVWQRVVQLRQDVEFRQECLYSDVEWVGSEDGVYLIGSDIGDALQEDLIDEIVADFLVETESTELEEDLIDEIIADFLAVAKSARSHG